MESKSELEASKNHILPPIPENSRYSSRVILKDFVFRGIEMRWLIHGAFTYISLSSFVSQLTMKAARFAVYMARKTTAKVAQILL